MTLPSGPSRRPVDLGLRIGLLQSGPTASIVDVPGVGVGHATLWRDEPPPPEGRGVARTGVTVLNPGGDPYTHPVVAGGAVLNGAGECTGFIGVSEWGLLETPVFLTSTMQVGRVYDAACELLMAEHPEIGAEDVIIPMVAECDDSWLSDARSMQVSAGDVKAALSAARSSGAADEKRPPAEGAVGAGTGMTCLGFKGGIGTSSRVLPSAFMLGVLVLTNFGDDARLTIDGLPVGRILGAAGGKPPPRPQSGSCIVVIATDAPLDAAACTRLARRAGLGLARTGSTGHHGSGEIFVALSTGLRRPRRAGPPPAAPLGGSQLDLYFDAAVEATEEAVLNSLLAARTVTGRDGNTSPGLPVDDVLAMLEQAGRLTGRSE